MSAYRQLFYTTVRVLIWILLAVSALIVFLFIKDHSGEIDHGS